MANAYADQDAAHEYEMERSAWISERADAILDSPLPAAIREVDEYVSELYDSGTYVDMQAVLADLFDIPPADLLGTTVCHRLYALAKQCAAARDDDLRMRADNQAAAEWEDRKHAPD